MEDEQPLLYEKEENKIQKDEQILLTGQDVLKGSSLRTKKVKIYLDTHISVKYKLQQPTELFDGLKFNFNEIIGNLKLHQLIKKLNLKELLHLEKNSQILVYMSSSFLANPFDTLADLSQAYGTPSILSNINEEEKQDVKQLTLKISVDNAWG